MTIPQTTSPPAAYGKGWAMFRVAVYDDQGQVQITRVAAAATPEDALTWAAGHLGNGDGAK